MGFCEQCGEWAYSTFHKCDKYKLRAHQRMMEAQRKRKEKKVV